MEEIHMDSTTRTGWFIVGAIGLFILALIVSPIVFLPMLLVMYILNKTCVPKRTEEPTTELRRPCPMCRELILRGARKCRYCGEILPTPSEFPKEKES